MYRPNFCVECGERVERARWFLWTSRRFCLLCEKSMRKTLMKPLIIASLAIFSVGLLTGYSLHRPRPAPPLVSASTLASTTETKLPKNGTNQPASKTNERVEEPAETRSICGARTKKGTPCSRRVHGVGRCWQHRGLPAMLPPEKLIVK